MAEAAPESRSRRPVFGWVSVGIAASVFLIIVISVVGTFVTIRLQATASGHGVGAVAGGVRPWVFYLLVGIIGTGVVSAVVGLVRGERRRWLHVVGMVLNVLAPVAAVVTLRLLLAVFW